MKKLISCILCFVLLGCVCNAQETAVTIYNAEGGSLLVHDYEVEAYVAMGWYEYPVVKMYSETGVSIVVYESEVELYSSVGWHKNPGEVQTTLYAPGGRECTVFNYYVAEYLQVGWSLEKPAALYYPGTYILDYGAFANEECIYSETGDKLVYLYPLADDSFFDNYITWLKNDGWVLYFEDDNPDVRSVFLVDKSNSVMLAVSMNKESPAYISIVRS